jgi:hypothetical protein
VTQSLTMCSVAKNFLIFVESAMAIELIVFYRALNKFVILNVYKKVRKKYEYFHLHGSVGKKYSLNQEFC